MSSWSYVQGLAQSVGTKLSDGLEDAKKKTATLPNFEATKANLEGALKSVKSTAESVGSNVAKFDPLNGIIDLDKLQNQEKPADKTNQKSLSQAFTENVSKFLIPKGATKSNDIHEVTPRVFAMKMPTPEMLAELNNRFGEKCLIYNLSEGTYDDSVLKGEVIEYSFPGHSAPPLGLLFKLCLSIESWLSGDEEHVIVVHCLTGKGRTLVLLSCLLSWIEQETKGLPAMSSPMHALDYICKKLQLPIGTATLPSQRLYVQYFANVLDGVRPRMKPVVLKRVTVNSKGVAVNMMSDEDIDNLKGQKGSRPYIQLFKNGKLLFSSIWADEKKEEGTPVYTENTTITFECDCVLEGDILFRCRHIDTSSKKSLSMFRSAFHTGFMPLGVSTLDRSALDGVQCTTDKDFDVTFEFEECPDSRKDKPEADNSFDDLIASKSSFWEEISKRKARKREYKDTEGASTAQSNATPAFSILGDEDDSAAKKVEVDEFSLRDDSWQEELKALSFETKNENSGATVDESTEARKTENADDLELLEKELGAEDGKETSKFDSEVDDLELLEKELGGEKIYSNADGLMSDAKGQEVTDRTKDGAPDEDLAELEEYLNSVGEA